MWFEIAVVAVFLLVGQVLLGHFEEQIPRWRMLIRHGFGIALFTLISYFFGQFWFWIALAVTLIMVLLIHLWWLPKNGVNGWTGEPKERYCELRGWKQ